MRVKVFRKKYIKDRKEHYTWIMENGLNESRIEWMKRLYCKYYTPRIGTRYSYDEIVRVYIDKPDLKAKYYDNHRCIRFTFSDGVDYSVSKDYMCGSKRNKKADITDAFRIAIQEQIDAFRIKEGAGPNEEVDHKYPFWLLRDNFFEDYSQFKMDELIFKDNISFTNGDVLTCWRIYHRQYAVLELLPIDKNRKKSGSIDKTFTDKHRANMIESMKNQTPQEEMDLYCLERFGKKL